jgi:SAM-dependent methyltransferase
VFGAPGSWDLKRCHDPACGLLWLDPEPIPDDLLLVYRRYYTHGGASPPPETAIRRLYHHVQGAYLARRFGYRRPAMAAWTGWLLLAAPQHRYATERLVFGLAAVPSGRLLEVGCGSGALLLPLQRVGWTVEGVEPDPQAVSAAHSLGLEVHLGTLEEQAYPADRYDAVVLNHVLEHVYDPVPLLAECRRVLKPGGRLVVVTPNHESWGHRRYGRAWRGLEPPRHLRIFSPRSVEQAARRAGFAAPVATTSPGVAAFMAVESSRIARADRGAAPLAHESLQRLAGMLAGWGTFAVQRGSGDEVYLQAPK